MQREWFPHVSSEAAVTTMMDLRKLDSIIEQ